MKDVWGSECGDNLEFPAGSNCTALFTADVISPSNINTPHTASTKLNSNTVLERALGVTIKSATSLGSSVAVELRLVFAPFKPILKPQNTDLYITRMCSWHTRCTL